MSHPLPAGQWPQIDVGCPAGQGLRDTVHQQQVGGARENEAAVLAGTVLIHRALDREKQVRLALNLIENDPVGAPDQVIRAHSRALPNPKVVERQVETIVEKRLGLHQRTLAGLTGTHQDDDR